MASSRILPVTLLSLFIVSCTAQAPTSETMMDDDVPTMGMPVMDDDPTNDNVDEMVVEEDGSMDDSNMMDTIEDAGGDGMMDKPMMARTVKVTADNWTFSPSTITASVGELVILEITGAAGTHGFAIPDLGINESVAPGQTVSIELPTDTAGTFSFKCSIPCGGGHKTMVGTIVIE